MTFDHDARTNAVVAWLREDAHEDAERVLLQALNDVDRTPQRRATWPAWRLLPMNGSAKPLLATAAVVVVAVAGIALVLPRTSGPGAPPSTAPSPTPGAPVMDLPDSGDLLPAGTYRVPGSSLLITLPSGWDVREGRDLRKHRDLPGEVALGFFGPDIAIYPDACANDVEPPTTGPTVAALLDALDTQQQSVVSDPTATTAGQVEATRVDVAVPPGLDPATCFEGILRIWTATGGYLAWGNEPSGVYRPAEVTMADTPGGRVVFVPAPGVDASAADVAELESIIDSMVIEE